MDARVKKKNMLTDSVLMPNKLWYKMKLIISGVTVLNSHEGSVSHCHWGIPRFSSASTGEWIVISSVKAQALSISVPISEECQLVDVFLSTCDSSFLPV